MLAKRSFSLSGHRTSVALEPAFWSVLEGMAAGRGMSLGRLVASIDAARSPADPLASRLRLAALEAALTLSKPESGQAGSGEYRQTQQEKTECAVSKPASLPSPSAR